MNGKSKQVKPPLGGEFSLDAIRNEADPWDPAVEPLSAWRERRRARWRSIRDEMLATGRY